MALATAPHTLSTLSTHDGLIAALNGGAHNTNHIPEPPASQVRLRLTKGEQDAALVDAVLAGDASAFRVIWNKYVALVRSKLGHVRQDIDDCVQEVFIRLHARLPHLRDRTALSSFIIGITLRVAGTELRRRKSASWILLTPTGDLPDPAPTAKPEDDVSREALQRFQGILGKLGPRARRVFELRYVERKELVEVAREMNVSLATAKRHLARVNACVRVMSRNDPVLAKYASAADQAERRVPATSGCSCFQCAALAG